MLSLVIGGARSGKSRFAQSLCPDSTRTIYLATARAEDAEMAARIERHRRDRPAHWITIEEPLSLAAVVQRHAADCDFLLLDCLTLWLSNYCWEHRDLPADTIRDRVLCEVSRLTTAAGSAQLIVVTNELGCGLVPESALAREFRDLQGWANQEIARAADWVYHLVAGIPTTIKRPGGDL